MITRLLTAFVVASCLAACSKSSPSAPTPTSSTPTTPAAPAVSSLRIEGLDAVRTGFFSDYTATATMSNGTSQTVTPTWSSSSSGIATVDSAGRLTGVSHGGMSINATYQGASASKNVSIVLNFGGTWSGRAVMRTCDQSGIFASIRYCQALGPNGSTFPISMTIAQGGNDRTQLTGTLNLGTLAGAFTGNVTGDARMIIGTNLTVTTSGVTFTYRVGGWESRISGTSSMTGQWADNLAAIGTVGNAYTENTIQTFTRTSVADVPITPAQLHYVFPTVQDFVSVLRGR